MRRVENTLTLDTQLLYSGIRSEVIDMKTKIRKAKTKADFHKQGIHLLNPDARELEDAQATAERDLYSTIWIHVQDTWLLKSPLTKSKSWAA